MYSFTYLSNPYVLCTHYVLGPAVEAGIRGTAVRQMRSLACRSLAYILGAEMDHK